MNNTRYSRQYFSDRNHLDLHIANAIKIFALRNNLKRILDVGTGTGLLVDFLSSRGFKAKGCDKYFKSKKIILASAEKLPFASSSFDLVCAISVIEHLSFFESEKFLDETFRVLRPAGYVFLITPNFASPFRAVRGQRWFAYSDPTHVQYFTPKSLSSLLINHGFSDPKLRFKIDPQVKFDWHLPGFVRFLPDPFKYFLTYLLISSPFSTLRDSFWICACKPL